MRRIILSYFLSFLFLITGLYITVKEQKNISEKYVNVLIDNEVLKLPLEEYILGVVSGEMPASFETEALKAQAVAARTYLFYNMDKDKHKNADVCANPSCCCAYYTREKLMELKGEEWINNDYEKIRACVNETKNQIMTYEKKPVLAVFHSAAGGGRTENSGDVWSADLPYLKSVETFGEQEKSNFLSTFSYSISDFKRIIKAKYNNANLSTNPVGEIKKTDGGAVDTVCLYGVILRGVEVRSLFSLPSAVFDIIEKQNEIIFNVKGYGHGVGMSQYGANYMASQGKSYTEILKNYYSGVEITTKAL